MRKATHEGILPIGKRELTCAVLDDGTRVLTQSAVFEAFGRPRRGKSAENSRADQVPSFMDANNLQPFVTKALMERINLIDYKAINGQSRSGYDARILRNLCKLYIDANDAGALVSSQIKLVAVAKEILYALSEVGITALVDEATGYQYERERDELQRVLRSYVSDDLLPWQKRFPDEFYKNIFRLNGWDYTQRGIKKRPGVIGKWTLELVYNQLPYGVIDELKRLTPKDDSGKFSARLHQSLTHDIGHPHLTNQINQVIGMMKGCDTWSEFQTMFNKSLIREAESKMISDIDHQEDADDDDNFRLPKTLFD